ncbi:MAG: aminotransferase class IV [Bacteroidales bacterium]|jgi:branched-chain amino acid aminotransferase|nr:aminotransferase class IV [Bacteroidales bacterium]
MMNECYGKKFILNGELEPCDQFSNAMVYEGDSVYEVIRMYKGNPVFFYDHMERLEMSTRLQQKKMLADAESLKKDIINLSKSDRKKEANLKIVFNYNKDSGNYMVYFIEPIYPTEEQYRRGVKGILFYAERKDPASKVINHKLRSSIYHKLILDGGYEALLVNEKGQVTEGSRSNIFFLKGNSLTTAPEKMILSGITRKHILDICREQNITVRMSCIKADSISDYEAVFMTGTSPMVLPFCCIDDRKFKVGNPLIEKLRTLYMERVEDSINRFRSGIK